jgi:hypothetical protein
MQKTGLFTDCKNAFIYGKIYKQGFNQVDKDLSSISCKAS